MISDGNCRGFWIIVGTNGVVASINPISPTKQFLRNHLKAIGVNPHFLSGVEVIEEVPVSNNIFTRFVHGDWDLIQIDLEFDKVFEAIHVDSCCGSNFISSIPVERISLFIDE